MTSLLRINRATQAGLAIGLTLLLALGAIGLVSLSPTDAHAAAKPKISSTSKKVVKGKSFTLKVKNTGGKKVTWKSSNKKVATVSKKGKVTAKRAGSATITATVAGKKLTCKVKIYGSAKQKALAGLDGWWRAYGGTWDYACIKNGRMYRFHPKRDEDCMITGYSTSGVDKYKLSLTRVKRAPIGDGSAYLVKVNGKLWFCYNDNDHKTLSYWDGISYSGSGSFFREKASEVPSNLKEYMKKAH